MKSIIADILSLVCIMVAFGMIISSVIIIFIWLMGKLGSGRKAQNDLIYLEFLIRHGETDHLTRRNIQEILNNYLPRKEY